ncbi:MAG: 50S ribosomal protein L10, partial [Bacteroidia bacterium]|nr:50S ribosomal protein L10 [Bacteroidia bacterium]
MADLKDFAEQLVNLSVKEVNELADILKEEYGIEPAAAAVAVAAGGGAAGGGEAAEEKSEFDVILKAAGGSKLAVVKLVKELTGQLADNANIYLADISGLNAGATSDLRRACFKANVSLAVVKNTLLE